MIGSRFAVSLSVVCFPSAVIIPALRQTSLTDFNDNAYMGCMDCGIGDLRRMKEDDMGEYHLEKNIFIPQGADARIGTVDRRCDNDGGGVETRVMAYQLRRLADEFDMEFVHAAGVIANRKSFMRMIYEGAVNLVKALIPLFRSD